MRSMRCWPPTRAPSDWRLISGIDADTILEERGRYAQVLEMLPPGVALGGRLQHGRAP